MRTRIEVTQRHIARATRERGSVDNQSSGYKSWCHCPIARAVQRFRRKAEIGNDRIIMPDNTTVFLPARAKSFIRSFDAGDKVKPFGFTVSLPAKVR